MGLTRFLVSKSKIYLLLFFRFHIHLFAHFPVHEVDDWKMAVVIDLEAGEQQRVGQSDEELYPGLESAFQRFNVQYQGQKHCIDDEVFVKRLPVGHLDRGAEAAAVGHHVVERVEERHRGEEGHEHCSSDGGYFWTHVGQKADTYEELCQYHQHCQHHGGFIEPFDVIGCEVVEHLIFRSQGVDSFGEAAEDEESSDQHTTYGQRLFFVVFTKDHADDNIRQKQQQKPQFIIRDEENPDCCS